jgi:hypothetical protein
VLYARVRRQCNRRQRQPGQQQQHTRPQRHVPQRAASSRREQRIGRRIDGDRAQRRLLPAAPELQADGMLTCGGERCAVYFHPAQAIFVRLSGQFRRQQRHITGRRPQTVDVARHSRQAVGRSPIHCGVKIGPVVTRRQQQPERITRVGERHHARRLSEWVVRRGRVGASRTYLPATGIDDARAGDVRHDARRQRSYRARHGATRHARAQRQRQQQPEQASGKRERAGEKKPTAPPESMSTVNVQCAHRGQSIMG